jgi:multisubunit Na+/H+ antiporter MnhB subunit
MKKSHYFIVGLAAILVVFVMSWLKSETIAYDAIVYAIAGLSAAFGGVAAYSGAQTGKNFNKDYWEATHKDGV